MLVESTDVEGAKVYEMIIKQIFQDLQLSPSVKDMRVFVDPKEVVFILAIKMDKTSNFTMLGDVTSIEYDKESNKTIIRVKDENYLPNILKKLWLEKGRENVHQPDRFSFILEGKEDNLNNLVIDDPYENLKKRVYDAIFRIIPEGFRIIRDISKDDVIAIVCTDELIKDEWLDKGLKYVEELTSS
ncbi:MAG: methanogenesis marker 17 protein [Methanobrevibacter arboriphilus]|jgi:putative methanogenesis marker protein 17|uniref:Methanogenesis marker 17 protein n=2 Tax=Methanobrevibacter arboriphilus TaxID=39441 RepID=A0A843AEA9_METAZ|nr:methanogenesis marker 17 protein [Methanobrevibacter arboriphilus]MBF4468263.1 methanogenesis marker 17 protein [Methanobrevibacter arboriphilus]MCC7561899.1 methanogenesis marker 17 protein [Methanobrevibacter arboriphilus]BBL61697.1 methanogenesis marker 17 protein [Methanobrevibacter arboriphilus]GLI12713.1 methanogenesis marker 17 protein [Methanobrevibacter arboriphilus]